MLPSLSVENVCVCFCAVLAFSVTKSCRFLLATKSETLINDGSLGDYINFLYSNLRSMMI